MQLNLITIVFLSVQFLAFGNPVLAQRDNPGPDFEPESVMAAMYRVNDHFLGQKWKQSDRNWIRGTYYTGLMAFYRATHDSVVLNQARNWSAKHGWRTGTEWIYPANRMTCVQTYLELYFIQPDDQKIRRAREVMDSQISDPKPAAEQGWDYVDALYVGTPAYIMMSEATGDPSYKEYANRMFRDVWRDLYDRDDHLFYRDEKAKQERTANNQKVFWSRGNGWAFASIPRILDHLPETDTNYAWYLGLFREMASALILCQGNDGFWRTNLADPNVFPSPESSGTSFFTYGLAWGIRRGFLDRETYSPALHKAWTALIQSIDASGKVPWGQHVARKPETVKEKDWDEYVSGAFLLAASEVLNYSTWLGSLPRTQ